MTKDVVEFNVTDAAIAKMKNLYMGLTVKDVNDEEGYKAVREARLTVKGHRVEVEKKRKELKSEALAWGRKVDGEAKKIFAKLEPIESHLKEQERIVTDEKKRKQQEEERLFKECIDNRMAQLADYNASLPYMEVSTMGDDEFDNVISRIKAEHEAEQARIAEEKRLAEEEAARIADEQMAERKRLAEEREKQEAETKRLRKEREAEQKRQAEAQAIIDAEKAIIEAEKRKLREEQERLDRIEFEKKAAEQARIKAEADAKAEAERKELEAKQQAEAEAKEAARLEALKPDIEKAIKWLHDCQMSIPKSPEIDADYINDILDTATDGILTVINDARREIEK